jgi:20S proteasome subunit alpha 7
LAVQNLLTSKLLNRSANTRIYAADEHVAIAAAGLAPDALHLLKRAKEECAEYRKMYKVPVPANVMTMWIHTIR